MLIWVFLFRMTYINNPISIKIKFGCQKMYIVLLKKLSWLFLNMSKPKALHIYLYIIHIFYITKTPHKTRQKQRSAQNSVSVFPTVFEMYCVARNKKRDTRTVWRTKCDLHWDSINRDSRWCPHRIFRLARTLEAQK